MSLPIPLPPFLVYPEISVKELRRRCITENVVASCLPFGPNTHGLPALYLKPPPTTSRAVPRDDVKVSWFVTAGEDEPRVTYLGEERLEGVFPSFVLYKGNVDEPVI